MDQDGLQYLYEGHPDFAPLSSFGTIPGFGGLSQLITGTVPGVNIELSKVRLLLFELHSVENRACIPSFD